MGGSIDPRDLEEVEPKRVNQLSIPLKVLPKSLRSDAAQRMVEALLQSNDEYEALVILRQLKDVADEAAKILTPRVCDIFPVSEKKLTVMGATIELRGGKALWEYNDGELDSLEKKLKAVKDEIKQRQTFLQSMKEDMETVNASTGETNIIHRAKQQNDPAVVVVTFPE